MANRPRGEQAGRMADDHSMTYAEAVTAVRELVNRIDPMGLIAVGAPVDEYDNEVSDLVRLVMRRDRIGAEHVDAIWRRWFGDSYASVDNSGMLAEQAEELRHLQTRFARPG
jgi:hypothetical protein